MCSSNSWKPVSTYGQSSWEISAMLLGDQKACLFITRLSFLESNKKVLLLLCSQVGVARLDKNVSIRLIESRLSNWVCWPAFYNFDSISSEWRCLLADYHSIKNLSKWFRAKFGLWEFDFLIDKQDHTALTSKKWGRRYWLLSSWKTLTAHFCLIHWISNIWISRHSWSFRPL